MSAHALTHHPHRPDPLVHLAHSLPGSAPWAASAWLVGILALEYILIQTYSRNALSLYARLYGAGGLRRLIAHLIGGPATALHELAHALMCVMTRSPIYKIVLWKPTVTKEGTTFGYVEHGQYRDWRGAFVSLAPGILIPPGLALLNYELMGAALPGFTEIEHSPIWVTIIWTAILFIATSSAFPSYKDFEGMRWNHWLSTAVILTAAAATTVELSQWDGLAAAIAGIIQLLVPAAIVSAAYVLLTAGRARR